MDLREQTYVLAIARHRGIKKAAEELHVSPPTLSVFLSNLENQMGLPLFDRMGRQFVPTEAGKLYIKAAEEMALLNESYERQLADLKNETRGLIHIGIHPNRTLYLLADTMKRFASVYPGIRLITHEENSEVMFSMLLSGKLDFIINNRMHSDPSLVTLPLYTDRMVMVLREDHPLADSGILFPGETAAWIDLTLFKDETFILPSESQSTRQAAERAFASCGFVPQNYHIIENLGAGAQMAAEGLGISFNLESFMLNFHYPKKIRYFYVASASDLIQYYIIFRKDKYMPAHIHSFITLLKESTIYKKPVKI